MYSNMSASINESVIDYPILDSNLPFAQYITRSRQLIAERRSDLTDGEKAKWIIEADMLLYILTNL